MSLQLTQIQGQITLINQRLDEQYYITMLYRIVAVATLLLILAK